MVMEILSAESVKINFPKCELLQTDWMVMVFDVQLRVQPSHIARE